VVFNVTGFGRFHGVESNPTSELVKYLPAYLAEKAAAGGGTPHGVRFGSFTTIETSGVGALTALHDLALTTAPSSRRPAAVRAPPQLSHTRQVVLAERRGLHSSCHAQQQQQQLHRRRGLCGCTWAWQRTKKASSWKSAL
jgi:hypothetical protein